MPSALNRATPPDDLNEAQRFVVEHDEAPLLVIAGAGSGKTNTLAHRVAHLILSGADPKRIMLATFSRRAAAELNRRVQRLLQRKLAAEAAARSVPAYAGTFHSIGARLIREYAPRLGLDPQFTIHDREDSADLMNFVRHEAGLSQIKERFPTKATCLAIYSRVVNSREALAETLAKRFPWAAAHEEALRGLFAAYVEMKQRHSVLDYDDLLLYFAQMLAEGEIAADVAGRFDHLLVDEYQDTNRLQAEIVLALRPRGRGLTVVGDDAQSIYSFRAATVRNILDFPRASTRRRTSSRSSATTARRDRSWRRPTPLSRSRRSALRKTCGPSARRGLVPRWSPSARKSTRRGASPPKCSKTARRAQR